MLSPDTFHSDLHANLELMSAAGSMGNGWANSIGGVHSHELCFILLHPVEAGFPRETRV